MACEVRVHNGVISEEEKQAYVVRAKEKFGHEPIGMDITLDGEYVELSYDFDPVPFQRIRRITGYLVGTLDRFNDAKRSEESDRVKHRA